MCRQTWGTSWAKQLCIFYLEDRKSVLHFPVPFLGVIKGMRENAAFTPIGSPIVKRWGISPGQEGKSCHQLVDFIRGHTRLNYLRITSSTEKMLKNFNIYRGSRPRVNPKVWYDLHQFMCTDPESFINFLRIMYAHYEGPDTLYGRCIEQFF
jgi:hypothetical protein